MLWGLVCIFGYAIHESLQEFNEICHGVMLLVDATNT
jgi:hypothetical protein